MEGYRKMENYFEEMYHTICEFETAREKRRKERGEISRTYGWDSPEMAAWARREDAFECPFTHGAMEACRAWMRSRENAASELDCNDLPAQEHLPDFVEVLKEAGAKTLAVTEDSTALMRNIHRLAELGCTLEGICTVTHTVERFGSVREEQIPGLRFRL